MKLNLGTGQKMNLKGENGLMKKKLVAMILAIMMIAMVVAAYAVDTPNSNYDGNHGNGVAILNTSGITQFPIRKDIVLYNTQPTSIYAPNVTYTYAVAPAGTSATGTEIEGLILTKSNEETKVTVRNGISGGVTLSTTTTGAGTASIDVAFTNGSSLDSSTPLKEDVAATTTNASAARTSKTFFVNILPSVIYGTGSTHNPAGVYRYAITDNTTRATLAAAGILRDNNYDTSYKTLYLDVYLKNTYDSSGAINGLEAYGYVLFKSGTANTDITYSGTSTESNKLTGFNVDSELGTTTSGTTPVISDQYHTYNLTVTKAITGDLADKNNYFPFAISLAEAAGNTATTVYVTYSNAQNVKKGSDSIASSGTGVQLAAGATETAFSGELKDGGSITFTGIPSFITYDASSDAYTSTTFATANAIETNNTYDKYKASATVDGETTTPATLDNDSTTKVLDATTGTASLKTALSVDGLNSATTPAVVNNSIDFTNTLEAISPTGIVTRYAPYALILVAGVVLLVISKKRKKNTDEE